MNIFYLSSNPATAAMYHCDKHCVKMILETAQLLSSAHHAFDSRWVDSVYKKTHFNHPSSIWVRSSRDHYDWAYNLFLDLCHEYSERYDKTHKSELMRPFLGVNPVTIRKGFTQPPQCMPDEYKHPNSVIAYRKYYAGEKAHFAKWKNGNVPAWFTLLTTVNTNQMEANYA